MSQQRIVLSFLGVANYQETCYALDEQTYQTKFFAEALRKAYPEYKLMIVLTKEAQEKHSNTLKTICSFNEVLIPSGKNENELWNMFTKISDAVPEQANLIVDVTHGFRSQPMLALAACIYLRIVKTVNIERIIYAAFEAKTNEITPTFNLTPFLELIDWTVAAQQFSRYGNAAPMRDILKAIHSNTHKNQVTYKSQGLSSLGERLAELSDTLALIRPNEVLSAANKIPDTIEKSKKDLSNLNQVQPFNLLLERINQRIEPLVEAQNDLFSPQGFKAQAAMIQFYIDTEQYTQAITLAREAIVSKICCQKNLDTIKNREQVEKWLNDLANKERNSRQNLSSIQTNTARLWSSIRDLRNDINHAGMNLSPSPAQKALTKIKEVCDKAMKFITQESITQW